MQGNEFHLHQISNQYKHKKGMVYQMENKMILISSDEFGKGDAELGKKLLETFVTLLTQNKQLPVAIFCMNRGVYSLTEQSPIATQLKELANRGVQVLGCKTCIDYYKIEDEIVVGSLSSMLKFIELASKYEVITIS